MPGNSYPKKAMILGMKRCCGVLRFASQFQIVDSVTPIFSATSRCSSPRSSRRFRMWSPSVFNWAG